MSLDKFGPADGAIKNRKRKGRGNASCGGECGRGHKGQKSRSGHSTPAGFEGGQMKIQDIYDGAEDQTAWVQQHQCVKNSLPMCEYTTMPDLYFHPPAMDVRIFESSLLSAVTGIDYSPDELWKAGERIWNLRRAIMVLRENRQREDDTLNPYWFQRLAGGAQHLAAPLDKDKWEALKNRYYELCGWNEKNGRPTRSGLEELGMSSVADQLQAAGKLG